MKKLIFLLLLLIPFIVNATTKKKHKHYSPKSKTSIVIDKNKYPVTGIDISNHTGNINFEEVKKKNIDFVYMKATEGFDFIDNRFETNYSNVRKHNIPVGFYHFFRFDVGGKNQAYNFLRVIEGKYFELPLVLDIEEWSNNKKANKDSIVKEIDLFIDEINRVKKGEVIIYTNKSSFEKYIRGNFKNNVWLCSFKPISTEWTLWQHSHKTRIPGAQGWVDMNTFNGTRGDWNRYLSNFTMSVFNINQYLKLREILVKY